MQYELKTQIIEPVRHTFDHVAARYGDKPATRYQEGTIDLQATENFHYRPTWDPEHELYDPDYSALKLTDPYSFTDPRQYFYTPYVTNRAQMHDAFGKTLDYVSSHNLFDRTPEDWKRLIGEIVIPLRHYESGCQMVYSGAARFSYGATISQCCVYEGFDRVGNAQLISRVGITLGEQTSSVLASAKSLWMESEAWQPLRRYTEEALVEKDWAVGVIASDLIDKLLDTLIYRHLDEEALISGAGAYSLLAQHVGTWYKDHRKWLDGLYKAWLADEELGEANKEVLSKIVNTWLPKAVDAVRAIAEHADGIVDTKAAEGVQARAEEIAAEYEALGLTIEKE
ncbi:hypothetical protein [Enemella sp. A6]|uniref:hypothetical protein n=1 Tax=Enemella sp. A6 TaxID=3440152 RepID=UPI003EBD7350